jgi:hypothetical protein
MRTAMIAVKKSSVVIAGSGVVVAISIGDPVALNAFVDAGNVSHKNVNVVG